ncbi:MAG: proline reductase cluster protein PrdD [Firmicutes bacterium]|nr:proline reductase cluster protein PrdD [Bacillota bacterium]
MGLVIKTFHIRDVAFGEKNEVDSAGLLTVNKDILADICSNEPLIEKIDIQIIKPHDHDRLTNAILDIFPISTKALGKIGEGITHTLTGVYVMLTGVDSGGMQLSRYGVSYGPLKEHLCFGRAGTPGRSDFIISFDVTLATGAGSTRPGPAAAHRACDTYCSLFRERMKKFNGSSCTERHDYNLIEKPGAKRIAIVKQVPGQGALFDTQLLPTEPSGFLGGRSIIDLGNVPVILTPNEYRDGALRAL